jgi:hypothetical protein
MSCGMEHIRKNRVNSLLREYIQGEKCETSYQRLVTIRTVSITMVSMILVIQHSIDHYMILGDGQSSMDPGTDKANRSGVLKRYKTDVRNDLEQTCGNGFRG